MLWRPTVAIATVLGWMALAMPLARADVKPNGLISEGMVLQQQTKARIWGSADAGEKVTVRFREQEVSDEAGQDGRWSVQLDSKEAGGPFPLAIEGKNKIAFKNVLVGEVWVCSGQSNMEMSVGGCKQADKDSAHNAPANPQLRMFTVKKNPQDLPVADVERVVGGSAAGYRERLFRGWLLLRARRAGAPESARRLDSHELGRNAGRGLDQPAGAGSGPCLQGHDRRACQSRGKPTRRRWRNIKPRPKPPRARASRAPSRPPTRQTTKTLLAVLYNGMIAPLCPMPSRGPSGTRASPTPAWPINTARCFPMMIKNWRDDWSRGDFPFLFVQLAPFMPVSKEPQDSNWAVLREAQLVTSQKLPNTGMAVITDVGNEARHPPDAQAAGR